MFKISSRLFVKVKQTTGIVGLPVQPKWREKLIKLYNQLLNDVRTQIPDGVFYRKVVENNVSYFLRIVEQYDDYETVENIIDRGQVEELIIQAQDEIDLVPKMAEWKPWEITQESIDEEAIDGELRDFAFPDDWKRPDIKLEPHSGIYEHWKSNYQPPKQE
eukprot:GEZU01008185.1.p2 GENE.GEZU01008185.1~~GEZU01008185.1.p2  ORF type:complete len:161 (-),score=44.94 GEZU01008185.1:164-646(-)